jgi:hypothetical protein
MSYFRVIYENRSTNKTAYVASKLMLYVHTADGQCSICTQQTVNAVCAHNTHLMLYVRTVDS